MSQLHIGLTWTMSVSGVMQGSIPLAVGLHTDTERGLPTLWGDCEAQKNVHKASIHWGHIVDISQLAALMFWRRLTLATVASWFSSFIALSPSTSIVQIKNVIWNHWTHDLPNHGHTARERWNQMLGSESLDYMSPSFLSLESSKEGWQFCSSSLFTAPSWGPFIHVPYISVEELNT